MESLRQAVYSANKLNEKQQRQEQERHLQLERAELVLLDHIQSLPEYHARKDSLDYHTFRHLIAESTSLPISVVEATARKLMTLLQEGLITPDFEIDTSILPSGPGGNGTRKLQKSLTEQADPAHDLLTKQDEDPSEPAAPGSTSQNADRGDKGETAGKGYMDEEKGKDDDEDEEVDESRADKVLRLLQQERNGQSMISSVKGLGAERRLKERGMMNPVLYFNRPLDSKTKRDIIAASSDWLVRLDFGGSDRWLEIEGSQGEVASFLEFLDKTVGLSFDIEEKTGSKRRLRLMQLERDNRFLRSLLPEQDVKTKDKETSDKFGHDAGDDNGGSPKTEAKDRCPRCGAKVNGKKCAGCGHKLQEDDRSLSNETPDSDPAADYDELEAEDPSGSALNQGPAAIESRIRKLQRENARLKRRIRRQVQEAPEQPGEGSRGKAKETPVGSSYIDSGRGQNESRLNERMDFQGLSQEIAHSLRAEAYSGIEEDVERAARALNAPNAVLSRIANSFRGNRAAREAADLCGDIGAAMYRALDLSEAKEGSKCPECGKSDCTCPAAKDESRLTRTERAAVQYLSNAGIPEGTTEWRDGFERYMEHVAHQGGGSPFRRSRRKGVTEIRESVSAKELYKHMGFDRIEDLCKRAQRASGEEQGRLIDRIFDELFTHENDFQLQGEQPLMARAIERLRIKAEDAPTDEAFCQQIVQGLRRLSEDPKLQKEFSENASEDAWF